MPYQVEFLDIQKVDQYVDELRRLARFNSLIIETKKNYDNNTSQQAEREAAFSRRRIKQKKQETTS